MPVCEKMVEIVSYFDRAKITVSGIYIYILFFFPIAKKNGNFPWLVLIFGYLLFRIAQYFNDRFLVVEN